MDILYSSIALYFIFNEEINEYIKYYINKIIKSFEPKKKYSVPSKEIQKKDVSNDGNVAIREQCWNNWIFSQDGLKGVYQRMVLSLNLAGAYG